MVHFLLSEYHFVSTLCWQRSTAVAVSDIVSQLKHKNTTVFIKTRFLVTQLMTFHSHRPLDHHRWPSARTYRIRCAQPCHYDECRIIMFYRNFSRRVSWWGANVVASLYRAEWQLHSYIRGISCGITRSGHTSVDSSGLSMTGQPLPVAPRFLNRRWRQRSSPGGTRLKSTTNTYVPFSPNSN